MRGQREEPIRLVVFEGRLLVLVSHPHRRMPAVWSGALSLDNNHYYDLP